MRVANLYKAARQEMLYGFSRGGTFAGCAATAECGQGPPAPQLQMQRSQPSYKAGSVRQRRRVAQHPPPPALRYADGNQQAYHQHATAKPARGAGQAMQQLRHEERSYETLHGTEEWAHEGARDVPGGARHPRYGVVSFDDDVCVTPGQT